MFPCVTTQSATFIMRRARKNSMPDSVVAYPEASRLLPNLISSGVVKAGDSAKKVMLTPKL